MDWPPNNVRFQMLVQNFGLDHCPHSFNVAGSRLDAGVAEQPAEATRSAIASKISILFKLLLLWFKVESTHRIS